LFFYIASQLTKISFAESPSSLVGIDFKDASHVSCHSDAFGVLENFRLENHKKD